MHKGGQNKPWSHTGNGKDTDTREQWNYVGLFTHKPNKSLWSTSDFKYFDDIQSNKAVVKNNSVDPKYSWLIISPLLSKKRYLQNIWY